MAMALDEERLTQQFTLPADAGEEIKLPVSGPGASAGTVACGRTANPLWALTVALPQIVEKQANVTTDNTLLIVKPLKFLFKNILKCTSGTIELFGF